MHTFGQTEKNQKCNGSKLCCKHNTGVISPEDKPLDTRVAHITEVLAKVQDSFGRTVSANPSQAKSWWFKDTLNLDDADR
ncbi:uncharacterized protein VP01_1947g2 [Puccinia sorghi]|uniref:Uncharacterized protein n=1 Tax=Puccinia sorghi TaxID=27349 RepID=A0A0L6VC64_9BASI|nr:uncharacterized protein VP01_1947g2 [Puccinia sorghi]